MEKLKQTLISLLGLVIVSRGVPTAAHSGAIIVCAQFILSLVLWLAWFLLGWLLPMNAPIVIAILDITLAIALLHFYGGLHFVTGSASLLKSMTAPETAGNEFAAIVQAASPLLALCLYPAMLFILIYSGTGFWLFPVLVLSAASAVELLRPKTSSRTHWIAACVIAAFFGILHSKCTGSGNGLLIAMLGIATAIICAHIFRHTARIRFTWCTAYLLNQFILLVVFILATTF